MKCRSRKFSIRLPEIITGKESNEDTAAVIPDDCRIQGRSSPTNFRPSILPGKRPESSTPVIDIVRRPSETSFGASKYARGRRALLVFS